MDKEWLEKAALVQGQLRETVQQEAAGVTVRMATLTCPCGRERALVKMYQCLYCKVWMCDQCAEAHFGKTVAEYRAAAPSIMEHPQPPQVPEGWQAAAKVALEFARCPGATNYPQNCIAHIEGLAKLILSAAPQQAEVSDAG